MEEQEFIRRVQDKNAWIRSIPAFLLRSGVDRHFVAAYAEAGRLSLPDGAVEYLQQSNSRLRELREGYTTLGHDGVKHSRWTRAYVEADLPFLAFRGDCAFLWQHRDFNLPANYLLTYYYLMASGREALLSRLTEDDLFGAYALRVGSETITRDRLDSACEISFLERHLSIGLGTPFRILDIGCGYGRLGHRFVQAFENATVWCVDAVAEASFLCEYYLRVRKVEGRSEMVPLFDLEDRLQDAKIDVAVNVHSFSECRKSAIAWWVRLLRRHSVPYLMIVPNPDGTRLLSLEDDGSRSDFVPVLEAEGYRCVAQEQKFAEDAVQRLGVSPTRYYLFRLFLD